MGNFGEKLRCATFRLGGNQRVGPSTHGPPKKVFQLENPEIMIRFSLLPYQSFNDEEDLTNEEFLNRIQEPIDGEMIAVSII